MVSAPEQQSWVYEVYDQRRQPDGLLYFEYRVWSSEMARLLGNPPFLLNSHRAMIRQTHQRIRLDADGRLLHVSGAAVAPDDVPVFLANDDRAYRWSKRVPVRKWEDERGRQLDAFVFPDYWGRDEELDPQWLRETFAVLEAEQVAAAIGRFLDRAAAHGWTGDRRGTTLNLEVAASADDSSRDSGVLKPTAVYNRSGANFGAPYHCQMRYDNVTIPSGATINSAVGVFTSRSNNSNTTVKTNLTFEDADDPGQVVSASDFDDRILTTAFTAWDNIAAWSTDESGADTTSPSLVATLQEVIDRPGWASGQALNLYWKEDDSTSASDVWRTAYSYDGSTTQTPRLDIDYSEAPAAPTITDVDPSTFAHGDTSTITGTGFGATQGTGKVLLSPTDDVADLNAVEATINTWADTSLSVDWVTTGLSAGGHFVFVVEDGGASNAAGFAVTVIASAAVAGSQGAPTGSIGAVQDLSRTLAGSQGGPGGTISAVQDLSRSVAGAQGGPSGTATVVQREAVAGAQPAPSGTAAPEYKISPDGAQDAPSGVLGLDAAIALDGAQAAPSGGVDIGLTVEGAQDAPSGALSALKYLIALAGAQAAPEGDVALLYKLGPTGAQDAPEGAVTPLGLVTVAGEQAAPSGAVSLIKYLIALAGEQGAPSATLGLDADIALAGAQGEPSGVVTVGFTINPAGAQGAPSGTITVVEIQLGYWGRDIRAVRVRVLPAKTNRVRPARRPFG